MHFNYSQLFRAGFRNHRSFQCSPPPPRFFRTALAHRRYIAPAALAVRWIESIQERIVIPKRFSVKRKMRLARPAYRRIVMIYPNRAQSRSDKPIPVMLRFVRTPHVHVVHQPNTPVNIRLIVFCMPAPAVPPLCLHHI